MKKRLISSESLTWRSSFIIQVTLICVLFPGNTIKNKDQKRIRDQIHFWEKFSETRYLLEIDLRWENQLKVFKTNISVNNLNWSISVKMCQTSTNPGCKYEKHVKLDKSLNVNINNKNKSFIHKGPSHMENLNKVCWMFSSNFKVTAMRFSVMLLASDKRHDFSTIFYFWLFLFMSSKMKSCSGDFIKQIGF